MIERHPKKTRIFHKAEMIPTKKQTLLSFTATLTLFNMLMVFLVVKFCHQPKEVRMRPRGVAQARVFLFSNVSVTLTGNITKAPMSTPVASIDKANLIHARRLMSPTILRRPGSKQTPDVSITPVKESTLNKCLMTKILILPRKCKKEENAQPDNMAGIEEYGCQEGEEKWVFKEASQKLNSANVPRQTGIQAFQKVENLWNCKSKEYAPKPPHLVKKIFLAAMYKS